MLDSDALTSAVDEILSDTDNDGVSVTDCVLEDDKDDDTLFESLSLAETDLVMLMVFEEDSVSMCDGLLEAEPETVFVADAVSIDERDVVRVSEKVGVLLALISVSDLELPNVVE